MHSFHFCFHIIRTIFKCLGTRAPTADYKMIWHFFLLFVPYHSTSHKKQDEGEKRQTYMSVHRQNRKRKLISYISFPREAQSVSSKWKCAELDKKLCAYGLSVIERNSLKIQIELEYVFQSDVYCIYEISFISLAKQFPLSLFNDLRQRFYDAFALNLCMLCNIFVLCHRIVFENNAMKWLRLSSFYNETMSPSHAPFLLTVFVSLWQQRSTHKMNLNINFLLIASSVVWM